MSTAPSTRFHPSTPWTTAAARGWKLRCRLPRRGVRPKHLEANHIRRGSLDKVRERLLDHGVARLAGVAEVRDAVPHEEEAAVGGHDAGPPLNENDNAAVRVLESRSLGERDVRGINAFRGEIAAAVGEII